MGLVGVAGMFWGLRLLREISIRPIETLRWCFYAVVGKLALRQI
jgi:hypothetical protein